MAEPISDVIKWLQGFMHVATPDGHEPFVGIDDGGLSLQIVGTEEYFEIGGLPEDVILDTEEVMKSLVDSLRGRSGEELAMIHNTYCDDDCKIEYLKDSMWREK